MSIEELLKPRYKVIAEDTSGNFRIGDMFIKSDYGEWFESGTFEMPEWELKKYPHLFRELEWHEERKESEMPEYVKRISKDDFVSWHNIEIGEVVKPTRWLQQEGHMYFFSRDNESSQLNYDTGCFIPATEKEFQYQQNKNV